MKRLLSGEIALPYLALLLMAGFGFVTFMFVVVGPEQVRKKEMAEVLEQQRTHVPQRIGNVVVGYDTWGRETMVNLSEISAISRTGRYARDGIQTGVLFKGNKEKVILNLPSYAYMQKAWLEYLEQEENKHGNH